MLKTFFGLDLKTGGKVIIITTLIENVLLYVLSLAANLESHGIESEYRGILLHLEELDSHMKWSK
jgi:hypothetical protein